MFRVVRLSLIIFGMVLAAPSLSSAQTRYVSATGSDSVNNTCTVASTPCATLSFAHSKATDGDTLLCLSPGRDSSFIITKNISVDCFGNTYVFRGGGSAVGDGTFASLVVNASTNATISLRGLRLGCEDFVGQLRGVAIVSAASVRLSDSDISECAQSGVFDRRTTGQTKLFLENVRIHHVNGPGIVSAAQNIGITVLNNVRSENNTYGLAAAASNNVVITNSIFSGNTAAGVEADAGAQITASRSVISHNNYGIQSGGSVRLSDSEINFNNVAVSGTAASLGNNRFSGNGSVGNAPTRLANAPADVGP